MPATVSASQPFLEPTDRPAPQRFVSRGISWEEYQRISDAFPQRHLRLTYDRGTLELMTISAEHSFLSRLLHDMVRILARAVGTRRRSCGDMTCDRQDLDRGFEPDECYYLTNEPAVRGKMDLDFTIDPPPDLGIEIDVTSDSRNRLPLYAALGIGEVWRFKNERISFLCLQDPSTYVEAERSRLFPFLSPADIEAILVRRTQTDEDTLLDDFEAWVRRQLPA